MGADMGTGFFYRRARITQRDRQNDSGTTTAGFPPGLLTGWAAKGRMIRGAAEGNETHISKRRKRRYGREENVGFGVHKIVCGPLLLRFTLVYSGLVWFGLVDFS